MQNLELTPEQFDILKEIGSIGAANSATALSQLLCKKVTISVPNVRLLGADELPTSEFITKSGDIGIAASSTILGTLTGGMLVLFSQSSALLMIDILMRREIGTTQFFNIMDASALSECSSILCCSYLNAITEFLNLYKLVPSINQIYMDKIDKLTRVLVKDFMNINAGYALPIENNLVIAGTELNLFVVFLLDVASVNKILKSVGL
ncbi:MAG: chemotaxis protein CheC [Candidatus Omnitrophica bacterium]|nr:chemotaxis protein CheC [Candidatus Omnitrophota bacterium]